MKEINIFIQQACINQNWQNKQNIYFFQNPEKIVFLQKISSSTMVFNICEVKKCFLEQQIGILEWFLKDHVTLKTAVMMLKIQLWSKEYITF